MEALILAAGRGERLRPQTDHTPKPLLEVGHKTLIEHQICKLVCAGIKDIVINLAHLGDQIESKLENGADHGAHIVYSREPEGALETGGGIVAALKYIKSDVFAVVNSDIYTDFPFIHLPADIPGLAWLVLVDNPAHHSGGDFVLEGERVLNKIRSSEKKLTFSGIAVYHRDLFSGLANERFPLAPVLQKAASEDQITGYHYQGFWADVGTPERLQAIRKRFE